MAKVGSSSLGSASYAPENGTTKTTSSVQALPITLTNCKMSSIRIRQAISLISKAVQWSTSLRMISPIWYCGSKFRDFKICRARVTTQCHSNGCPSRCYTRATAPANRMERLWILDRWFIRLMGRQTDISPTAMCHLDESGRRPVDGPRREHGRGSHQYSTGECLASDLGRIANFWDGTLRSHGWWTASADRRLWVDQGCYCNTLQERDYLLVILSEECCVERDFVRALFSVYRYIRPLVRLVSWVRQL